MASDVSGNAPEGGANVALLFELYVGRREAGQPTELEHLYGLAGDAAEELRRRIVGYEELLFVAELVAAPDGEPADPDELPESVGRFRPLRELGRGGMARVYLASDPELGRDVALKVLHGGLGPDQRARLLREARSLAGVGEHPGVVTVFDAREEDGVAWVAMEQVHGPTLAEVLAALRSAEGGETSGPDPLLAAAVAGLSTHRGRARLAAEIAGALAHCADAGVLHRDVKPENVLLSGGVQPRLIDFGLAHIDDLSSSTHVTAQLVATPAYTAPERVDAGATGSDARSDVFSFGVVLYELLTLENPFDRGTRHETLRAISRARPAPPRSRDPGLPSDLERIVLHCLERRPEDRYGSMRAVADDLARFLAYRSISLGDPSPWRAVVHAVRRRPRTSAVVLAAPVLLALLWVAEGARRCAEVCDAIEAARGRIASIEAPGSANRVLGELDVAGARAALLAAWPGATLFASPRAELAAALHELDEAMAARIAAERAQKSERQRPYDSSAWRQPLDRLEQLCPDCVATASERARGSIREPAEARGLETRLWRMYASEVAGTSGWEVPPNPVRPGAGWFRWLAAEPDGKVQLETEFGIGPDDPLFELAPRPPDPGLAAEMLVIDVDPADVERLRPAAPGPEAVRFTPEELVPARRIAVARFPVSWAAVRELARARPALRGELERVEEFLGTEAPERPRGPSDPATVPWWIADAYARSVGMRLPTETELLLALGHPELRARGPVTEWTSGKSASDPSSRTFLVDAVAPGPPPERLEPGSMFNEQRERGLGRRPIRFRLARTVEVLAPARTRE